MGRRALTWGLTLPLVGVSVLTGHALAYRVTGVSPGVLHAYLDHAPTVVALLALVALLGVAIDQRAGRLPTAPFAALGVAVFTLQEHLERYVHTGDVPVLVANRTFLVGVLLQVPVGIVAVWIARRLAGSLRARHATALPPTLAELPLVLRPLGLPPASAHLPVSTLGRGPPPTFRP